MLLFQWRALRVGDRVAVHDDNDVDLGLNEGEVAIMHTRAGGDHHVGVRMDATRAVVRPRRLAVHLLPVDATEDCWRCDRRRVRVGDQRPVPAGDEL